MQQPRNLADLNLNLNLNVQQAADGTFVDERGVPLVAQQLQRLHAPDDLFHHQQQQHQQQQQQQQELLQAPHAYDLFAPPPPPNVFQQQVAHPHHAHAHAHAHASPPFGLQPAPHAHAHAHALHTTTPRTTQRPLQIAPSPHIAIAPSPHIAVAPSPHIASPAVQQSPQSQPHHSSPLESAPADDPPTLASHGQFKGLKLIAHPPDLDEWRQRLFDVDDTITLTEAQFQTYFPHIDNVYSHRSTQRHKRKSFVSHYWDCRLKGRPPGTKKSTDPDKKKRKRVARERDLCDVKIKITEFFDQAEYEDQMGHPPPVLHPDDPLALAAAAAAAAAPRPDTTSSPVDQAMFFAPPHMAAAHTSMPQTMAPWALHPNIAQPGMSMFAPPPPPLPGPPPAKFYTFQRVNGNGGNGKGDGVAGPHKHTLEESDRVKKNIVVRTLAKSEKDVRKVQGGDSSKKTYHKKATGNALTTVRNHAKEEDLKLYGSCFCPFVQRVWISLEHKNLPYQYIEVDPYKKPQPLLDINPRGLVPALRHGPTWSTHESTVIMEYLEDLQTGPSLLPTTPQSRATSRLWTDHINRHLIPSFYALLQAQDPSSQTTHARTLRTHIETLIRAAHPTGPFFLGPTLSFVDVQLAPWALRLRTVMGVYRGWPEPEAGSRWAAWVGALEKAPPVVATTSTDELYRDSYERYAENRPGTSRVADAVNEGRGLP